ncbi:MAG TPA: hypothetical protein VL485_10745 [Ktedonobacteraceae bacterium]|jgi:hypothetical protein|nr:hypothetical protein [Ktedonobacteraceae bacterium]
MSRREGEAPINPVESLLVCDRGEHLPPRLRPGCSPIGDSRHRPGRRQAATLQG